ncbi:unnamed protein product [Coccothraustes coccothraustes]
MRKCNRAAPKRGKQRIPEAQQSTELLPERQREPAARRSELRKGGTALSLTAAHSLGSLSFLTGLLTSAICSSDISKGEVYIPVPDCCFQCLCEFICGYTASQ